MKNGFLKLTFKKEEREISKHLLDALERTNGVRAGYYDRYHGEQTIIVSLKKSCEKKAETAFRVLKIVVKMLREISDMGSDDIRYLLAAKFFLFYLTGERRVVLKPTIHPERCVICTKGRTKRIQLIRKAMKSEFGKEDEVHEAEHLCSVLAEDTKNDVCIALPCSILVYEKEKNSKLCGFDGMIIFPNRKERQVVFLKAKNRKNNPTVGKTELMKKMHKLQLSYKEEIQVKGMDAVLYFDI